jgi:hypothetical protein
VTLTVPISTVTNTKGKGKSDHRNGNDED